MLMANDTTLIGWICPRCKSANSPTLAHCFCRPDEERRIEEPQQIIIPNPKRKLRKMSKAAKQKIKAALKLRWAKYHEKKEKAAKTAAARSKKPTEKKD